MTVEADCSQVSPHENNNWVKAKPDKLKRPLSQPLKRKISIVNSAKSRGKEGSEAGNKKFFTSSRRCPSTIRMLTSSTLAEKYDHLIEKKLELTECLKKEHELRMKILNFDIALKKKELKAVGYTDIDIQLLDSCEVGI